MLTHAGRHFRQIKQTVKTDIQQGKQNDVFCEEETNYVVTLPPSNAKDTHTAAAVAQLRKDRSGKKKVPLVRVCKQAYHCLSLRRSVEKPSIDTTLRHSESGKKISHSSGILRGCGERDTGTICCINHCGGTYETWVH